MLIVICTLYIDVYMLFVTMLLVNDNKLHSFIPNKHNHKTSQNEVSQRKQSWDGIM
jgi:hypothetical protein